MNARQRYELPDQLVIAAFVTLAILAAAFGTWWQAALNAVIAVLAYAWSRRLLSLYRLGYARGVLDCLHATITGDSGLLREDPHPADEQQQVPSG